MAAITTWQDEFSMENPINHGASRWTRLIPLTPSDRGFQTVEKLFRKSWSHPKKRPKPRVHAIFKIVSPDFILKPYLQYRENIQRSPSMERYKNPGNERLLFHGTNRFCTLGEDSNKVRLCNLQGCLLCSIIRTSFDVRKCGSKHKFSRFGNGIYTTACSSKADDYTSNGPNNSSLRVLLVTRVVLGQPHKRRNNATSFTEPPAGYHSVVGEPGEDLNYEETVVYNNDAIRPAYLLVYGPPPEGQEAKLSALLTALFKTPLAS